MEFAGQLLAYLTDPQEWTGGLLERVWEHIWYSGVASLIAIAIALPVGLLVGHTDRGGQLAINVANFGRALPAFGIVTILFIIFGFGYPGLLVALVALGLPPIVTNTYVGVRAVDADVRDSAEGIGLTGLQVLRQVEVPVALPLIMAGIRTSVVQIVATATLGAVFGLGGLGRPIIDGLAQQDYVEVVAGAIIVALLAVATEQGLALLQRRVVPAGLQADVTRPVPAPLTDTKDP